MTDVANVLRTLVARAVDAPVERVEDGARFEQLGNWSSLAALRLLASVEDRFRVSLDLRHYLAIETVAELTEAVRIELHGDEG